MAKDYFHDRVKQALTKDGWNITDDPFYLKVGGVEFFIDLGAEKLIAAERNGRRIAVEIKSFINPSKISDFHLAVGQFLNYRTALKVKHPDRQLFLAIPEFVYDSFFQKEFPQLAIAEYQIAAIVVDIDNEEIVRWIT
ncbi:element excision factor XisH family protein [Roseofilum casamattae]|uniref:Element excision factor XisH family protein n=1 Tax=Roseofilum casamattae BLCC-M143 TaxID=3022442 RepID=A0ABT7C0T1_9CYAN|nr:element excision factor XisH family protein [Roseofilum casamattae]MDJ1185049.1 element excision factor XisH family protein [Roseofilum casamattae BLCC-M143]